MQDFVNMAVFFCFGLLSVVVLEIDAQLANFQPIAAAQVQLYQNITQTEFASFLFLRSANPNFTTFKLKKNKEKKTMMSKNTLGISSVLDQ